jgi:hypothetical protein
VTSLVAWCISRQSTDWDDLREEFLPLTKDKAIDVWVYLVGSWSVHLL